MQNLKKILIISTLTIFGLAFLISAAKGQETQSAQNGNQNIAEAFVNIYDAEIISQDNADIKINFILSNGAIIQPGVKYSVQLIQQKDQNQFIVDQKSYDETLSLNINQKINKEIIYTPPTYLKGEYQIWLNAKNDSGMLLAIANPGAITLNGTENFLELVNSSCYLRVDGELEDKKYNLIQGVDINPSENLIATCDVANHSGKSITVFPKYETHWRSAFGQVVEEEGGSQQALSFNPNEIKTISFILPKAKVPQAYDVTLTLRGENIDSNTIAFHYVLAGTSATIQNIQLENDYYSEGDLAGVSLFWTPSANSFQGARTESDTFVGSVVISIKNDQNQDCIDLVTKELMGSKKFDLNNLLVKIDCKNPTIAVAIKDKNGNTLDSKKLSIVSTDIIGAQKNGENNYKKTISIWVVLLIVLVFFIAVLVFLKHRKHIKNTLMSVLLLAVVSGLLISFDKTRGASFYAECVITCGGVCNNDRSNNPYCQSMTIFARSRGDVVFVVNLDSASYDPLGNIVVNATAWNAVSASIEFATLTVTINGQTQTLISNNVSNTVRIYSSVTMAAPSALGNYSADFVGYSPSTATTFNHTSNCTFANASGCNCSSYCEGSGSLSIPFVVGAPIATIISPAADATVVSGNSVDFSGIGTPYYSENTITAYEWRAGNCNTGTLLSSSQTFNKSFSLVGRRRVYLRVQENSESWSINCPSILITVITVPSKLIICPQNPIILKSASPTQLEAYYWNSNYSGLEDCEHLSGGQYVTQNSDWKDVGERNIVSITTTGVRGQVTGLNVGTAKVRATYSSPLGRADADTNVTVKQICNYNKCDQSTGYKCQEIASIEDCPISTCSDISTPETCAPVNRNWKEVAP